MNFFKEMIHLMITLSEKKNEAFRDIEFASP